MNAVASKAEKLLGKMRHSQSGWRRRDFETLYLGFGFIKKVERGSHTIYQHPGYPELTATVSRSSGDLHAAYARQAIKYIDRLLELEKDNEPDGEPDE